MSGESRRRIASTVIVALKSIEPGELVEVDLHRAKLRGSGQFGGSSPTGHFFAAMRGVAQARMAINQIVPDPEISIPVRPLRAVGIESLSAGRWAVCVFVLDRQDSGPSNHLQALRRD